MILPTLVKSCSNVSILKEFLKIAWRKFTLIFVTEWALGKVCFDAFHYYLL